MLAYFKGDIFTSIENWTAVKMNIMNISGERRGADYICIITAALAGK